MSQFKRRSDDDGGGPKVLRAFSLGGRIAWPVGLLLAMTIVVSLLGQFEPRFGGPLAMGLGLAPDRILHGEVYRLVTWAFVEPTLVGLLFGCLLAYFALGQLATAWSARRLLASYFGMAAAIGVVTTVVGLLDPAVRGATYFGGWPLGVALLVALGVVAPERRIRLFFLVELRAVQLAWLAAVATTAFGIYEGFRAHLPELVAIATMAGWIGYRVVSARIVRIRRMRAVAGERAARERAGTARRAAALAATKTVAQLDSLDEDEPPPMPPEVEAVLDRILDEAHREGRARRAKNRS